MKLHIFIRTALFALLCGLLAACQTTGLKPGSFETRFPISGWVKVQDRGTAAYYCRSCSTPQLIVTGPSKFRGDVESAIRNDILSTGLLSELVKSASRATGGLIRLQSRRKIGTKS